MIPAATQSFWTLQKGPKRSVVLITSSGTGCRGWGGRTSITHHPIVHRSGRRRTCANRRPVGYRPRHRIPIKEPAVQPLATTEGFAAE